MSSGILRKKERKKNLHLFADEITYSDNNPIFTILASVVSYHLNCETCLGVYYQTERENLHLFTDEITYSVSYNSSGVLYHISC
jgi:hypothetical protein